MDRSAVANDPRPSACAVLDRNKSSTYSSEYASGFFDPAALHLAAFPSPRNEDNIRQVPRK
jgi:hypothetical protein